MMGSRKGTVHPKTATMQMASANNLARFGLRQGAETQLPRSTLSIPSDGAGTMRGIPVEGSVETFPAPDPGGGGALGSIAMPRVGVQVSDNICFTKLSWHFVQDLSATRPLDSAYIEAPTKTAMAEARIHIPRFISRSPKRCCIS